MRCSGRSDFANELLRSFFLSSGSMTQVNCGRAIIDSDQGALIEKRHNRHGIRAGLAGTEKTPKFLENAEGNFVKSNKNEIKGVEGGDDNARRRGSRFANALANFL